MLICPVSRFGVQRLVCFLAAFREARAIGRTPSTISAWRKSRGTSGQIPRGAMGPILAYARTKKLDINALDLIVGRVVAANKKNKR